MTLLKPATAFLFELIARLQSIATVPMIDIRAYAKWLIVRANRWLAAALHVGQITSRCVKSLERQSHNGHYQSACFCVLS